MMLSDRIIRQLGRIEGRNQDGTTGRLLRLTRFGARVRLFDTSPFPSLPRKYRQSSCMYVSGGSKIFIYYCEVWYGTPNTSLTIR
jgi:hypothetical protein